MGQNKDAAIGLGIIAVIIVIIVGVVVWAISPGETKPVEQDESTNIQNEPIHKEKKNSDYTDEEVKEFIMMNYKGKDNSGDSLGQTLAKIIIVAYPGENIMENPSTSGSFTPDLNYDGYWDVYFDLKTYRESISYQWTVDMETKSVYAKNENGRDILDIIDAFD